jgi:hypothetical protein
MTGMNICFASASRHLTPRKLSSQTAFHREFCAREGLRRIITAREQSEMGHRCIRVTLKVYAMTERPCWFEKREWGTVLEQIWAALARTSTLS